MLEYWHAVGYKIKAFELLAHQCNVLLVQALICEHHGAEAIFVPLVPNTRDRTSFNSDVVEIKLCAIRCFVECCRFVLFAAMFFFVKASFLNFRAVGTVT